MSALCIHAGTASALGAAFRSLGAVLPGVFLLGVLVTPLVAPILLGRYRKRVVQYMNLHGSDTAAVADMDGLSPVRPYAVEKRRQPDASLIEKAAARRRRLLLATTCSYIVFCLGALCLAHHTRSPERSGLWQLPLAAAFLALGPLIVNLRPQASPLVRAALTVCGLGIMVIVAIDPAYWANQTGQYLVGPVADTAMGASLTFILCAMCIHRKVRTQFLSAALLCGWIASTPIVLIAFLEALVCSGSNTVAWLGLPWPLVLLVIVGAHFLTGMLGLWGLVLAYRHGWISDLSLAAMSGIVVIALMLAGQVYEEDNFLWVAVSWTFATLLTYGALMFALHPVLDEHAPALLVLRVFKTGRLAEEVLDAVQQRWRLMGPVVQIAGPDLAGLNVDLPEFAHFITGRLSELFTLTVPSRQAVERLLDTQSDAEGRFRISELFCINTSWAGTVAHLIAMADAIVIDLRGYTPQRHGTHREIEMLSEQNAWGRVVIVQDDATDLSATLHLIPNATGPTAPQVISQQASSGNPTQIWQALLAVAERPSF